MKRPSILFIAFFWFHLPGVNAGTISNDEVQVLQSFIANSDIAISDSGYANEIKQNLINSINDSLNNGNMITLFGEEKKWLSLSALKQRSSEHIEILRFRLSTNQFVQGKLKIEGLSNATVYLNQKKLSGSDDYSLNLLNGDYRVIVMTDKVDDWSKVNITWQDKDVKSKQEEKVNLKAKYSPLLSKDIGKMKLSPELLYDSETVSNISLSPDGKMLLWSKRSFSEDTKDKSINVTEIVDPKSLAVLYRWQAMTPSSVSWSNDNKQLAYLHDNAINVLNRDDFLITQVASHLKGVSGLNWFDNDTLIFSWNKSEDKPHKFTKRHRSIEDRWSYWRGNSQIYLLDTNSGMIKQVSKNKLSSNLLDFDSDKQRLLMTRDPIDYKEPPHSITHLIELDLTNQKEKLIGEYRTLSNASYSPNGIVISAGPSFNRNTGVALSKESIANDYDGQLYLMDSKGDVKPLSKKFNPSIGGFEVLENGKLLISATAEDKRNLYTYSFKTKMFIRIKSDIEVIESFTVSKQTKPQLVYKGTSGTSPQKVVQTKLGKNRKKILFDSGKQNYAHIQISEMKDWDYKTSKGNQIDGRYYLPTDFDSSKKYPAIIYYYGGTSPVSRAFTGRWPFSLWAAQGYVVYVLQPSGTIGYGQDFSAKHVNAWGLQTAEDIIESTRAFVKAHPFVDGDKIGNMGASYGGFMTMYLATKTDLFSASVSHAGISNLTSYWGYGWWGVGYSGVATKGSFPWNKTDFYTDQSPIFHADKVTTPLLLLHGDSDTNVPVGESHQMYSALKLLGKDVELVEFQGDDHHINARTHRLRWWETMIAYFDKKLKQQPSWWEHLYPSQK